VPAGGRVHPEPARDAPSLLVHLGVERPLELVRARPKPPLTEAAVDLRSHLVHPELDHREERGRWLEEGRKAEPGDGYLRDLQLLEGAAQVDQHEVAPRHSGHRMRNTW
jgi:hypothetical protein